MNDLVSLNADQLSIERGDEKIINIFSRQKPLFNLSAGRCRSVGEKLSDVIDLK